MDDDSSQIPKSNRVDEFVPAETLVSRLTVMTLSVHCKNAGIQVKGKYRCPSIQPHQFLSHGGDMLSSSKTSIYPCMDLSQSQLRSSLASS